VRLDAELNGRAMQMTGFASLPNFLLDRLVKPAGLEGF
jgi:hypothetical protein